MNFVTKKEIEKYEKKVIQGIMDYKTIGDFYTDYLKSQIVLEKISKDNDLAKVPDFEMLLSANDLEEIKNETLKYVNDLISKIENKNKDKQLNDIAIEYNKTTFNFNKDSINSLLLQVSILPKATSTFNWYDVNNNPIKLTKTQGIEIMKLFKDIENKVIANAIEKKKSLKTMTNKKIESDVENKIKELDKIRKSDSFKNFSKKLPDISNTILSQRVDITTINKPDFNISNEVIKVLQDVLVNYSKGFKDVQDFLDNFKVDVNVENDIVKKLSDIIADDKNTKISQKTKDDLLKVISSKGMLADCIDKTLKEIEKDIPKSDTKIDTKDVKVEAPADNQQDVSSNTSNTSNNTETKTTDTQNVSDNQIG